MQDQHTQEPVAEVCATSYRANDGDVHTRIEIRRLQNVKVGTLLYAFPPDASARIAELKKQCDMLLAALRKFVDSHEECTDFDGFTAQIVNMDDYHEAREVADSVKGHKGDTV